MLTMREAQAFTDFERATEARLSTLETRDQGFEKQITDETRTQRAATEKVDKVKDTVAGVSGRVDVLEDWKKTVWPPIRRRD